MVPIRQDAWSKDEDVLLAEVVLRHIREASTQLAAFEEVGKKLSRTPAACGFRWNSLIRKQYESAIILAKKHRKEQKRSNLYEEREVDNQDNDNRDNIAMIDEAIRILVQTKSCFSNVNDLEESYKEILIENEQLKHQLQQIEKEYLMVQEDYQSLLEIMERARKMVVFKDEDQENIRFQMDSNGNLEKVKK